LVSYEESMSEVGRGLALLLAEEVPVPDSALQPALAARHATARLLDELAGAGALGRRVGGLELCELVRNPMGSFNRLRVEAPVIQADDAHALLSVEAMTRQERLWLSVYRHAVVARHEWVTADPRSRPTGAGAWPVTADGAAVAAAVLHLEQPLSAALRRAGRGEDADRLDQARWSGLDRAALEVSRLAASGDLTDPPVLRRPGVANPLVVRSRPGQREGGRRLVEHLEHTRMSPQAVQAVLTLEGRTVLAAADIVAGTEVGAALVAHARELLVAARRLDACGSVQTSDPRAVMQAHQLHSFVAGEVGAGRCADVAMEVARRAPVTIAAVARRAREDVSAGRWLVADGQDHDRPLWVQADMGDRRPDVLDRLVRVTDSARDLAAIADPDPLAGEVLDVRLTPPREVLSVAAGTARPLGPRPADPSARLTPSRGYDTERPLPR
jgi:hypothetical protein